jgi:hypothetical protein
MAAEHGGPGVNDIGLVRGGPSHRLAQMFGFGHPTGPKRLLRVVLLALVTWAPLAVLSLMAGHFVAGSVKKPFLHDPEVSARFLFVLPLLELAEIVVALSLAVQARHFLERGVVPERERKRLEAAQIDGRRMRDSMFIEGVILVASYTLSLVTRVVLGFTAGASSWEGMGAAMTAAGWWYTLVSLPILYFFLLRWVWVFLLWGLFLFRVSRLDLELTPTHPDRTGGLGFVGWGLASFAVVVMAFSAVCSAGFADEILHRGQSLDSLKYHVILFVVVALLIVHAPLLAFASKLSHCRLTGLLEFGALAWRHDQAFDEKWIKNRSPTIDESLLGSADIQSLADIAMCYEHVERMWPIPFDTKAFAVLVLAALLPMIPLLGTQIPLSEIFMKLGELLV